MPRKPSQKELDKEFSKLGVERVRELYGEVRTQRRKDAILDWMKREVEKVEEKSPSPKKKEETAKQKAENAEIDEESNNAVEGTKDEGSSVANELKRMVIESRPTKKFEKKNTKPSKTESEEK